MGMGVGGGLGMSQADVLKMQLMQAKAERKTLAGRIAVTKRSIEILEKSLLSSSGEPSPVETLLTALIHTNLEQLRANLLEGQERFDYLDKVISSAESPIKKALIVPPNQHKV